MKSSQGKSENEYYFHYFMLSKEEKKSTTRNMQRKLYDTIKTYHRPLFLYEHAPYGSMT